MIEVRTATQEDLDYVSSNPLEGAVKVYPKLTLPENSYTYTINGEIACVGGTVILWPGVGEMWMILTANCKDLTSGTEIALKIRHEMKVLMAENNLWRIQASVRTDFPLAERLTQALGFIKEGVMKKYLPDGTDAYLYARVL